MSLTGLDLHFAGNINDSHFTRVNPGLVRPNLQDQNHFPNVPPNNFVGGADYQALLSDAVNLTLYSSYSFRGRQSDAGSGRLSAKLDQLTLRPDIETGPARIALFAEDALNEKGPLLQTAAGVNAVYPRRLGRSASFRH